METLFRIRIVRRWGLAPSHDKQNTFSVSGSTFLEIETDVAYSMHRDIPAGVIQRLEVKIVSFPHQQCFRYIRQHNRHVSRRHFIAGHKKLHGNTNTNIN